ncbi:MAG: TIGR04086 family membrane protein [Clostridia bacterium]|nr:TIGR04086 family membrane protein [Clostridia bacterium]
MKKAVISYLKSLIVSVIVYAAFLFIVAGISVAKDLSDEYMYYFSFVPIAFAAFSGGAVCAAAIGKRGFIHGMLSQAAFFVLLGSASFILSTKLSFILLIPFAVCLLSGSAGGIAAVNLKRR